MKWIVAGSRTFTDYPRLCRSLDAFHAQGQISEVVCGCAHGADMLGEHWAKDRSIPVKRFPANWKELGRGAGFIRNQQMADYADALIAFWDGESKGTRDMIRRAQHRVIDGVLKPLVVVMETF